MSSTPTGFIDLPTRLGIPAEQWKRLRWQLLCDLHVAVPAIIKSFDADKQTVTVQPAVQENIKINSVFTPVDLPILQDIPIVVPRAGGFAVTFPVQPGDECLVVFADMCIDAWYQSGGNDNVQIDRRRHDLSDGFAILGVWSQPRVLSNYSTDTLQIRSEDGQRIIEIADAEINLNILDGSDVNVNVTTGDVAIHADSGDVSVESSSGEVDISAPSVKISGGGTSIDTKAFLTHTHSGVTTGGGASGPVV